MSLRYFVTAAEYESFSKAAEYLYTTQPNISKHILKLEKELNVQLFHRTGQKVELTDVGQKCLLDVQEIVRKVDQLKSKVNKYKLGEYGNLNIGYTGEFNYQEFTNIVGSFGQKHPNIDISFLKGSQSQVLAALLQNEADVIFTLITGLDEIEGFSCYEIAQNELVLAVPEGHQFVDLDRVRIEDFREQSIILFNRHASPYVYDCIMRLLQKHHLYHNIVSFENDLQSMLLKVESGKGITIVTALSLRSSANKIRVINFAYDRENVNVNLALIWKKDNNNPSLQLFLQDTCT